MIRYRAPQRATYEQEKKLCHIKRLGRILSVKGYRFLSTRSYMHDGEKRSLTNDKECVLVKGENGTARFYATWSYGGSGPHLTRDILMTCGLCRETAELVAFKSPRFDDPGTDWELDLSSPNEFKWSTYHRPRMLDQMRKAS